MLVGKLSKLFIEGNALELVGHKLMEVICKADYRIFNLEIPLTDIEKPILKYGPNLIAPCSTVNGYKALAVNLLTLANNHIMDQDVQGLDSTCKVLAEAGIKYVGAGNSPEEAAVPHTIRMKDKKIGIYACAEHEFSIASDKLPGANPYDPLKSFDQVTQLKGKCDYIIVLYHGGKEHYRYPSPDLQKICRKFVDKGADLVICQHTHCVGCEERYMDSTIVYGQGNFLFDLQDNEFWQTGILIELEDDFNIHYIPIIKCAEKVRIATGQQAERILREFKTRSQEIKREGEVEKKYVMFAETMLQNYLSAFLGKRSLMYRILNKLMCGKLKKESIKLHYSKESLLSLRNYIECEAHREMIIEALKNEIRKDSK